MLPGIAVFHRDKRNAKHNQRHANGLEIIEKRVQLVVKQDADHRGRHAGDDDLEPQAEHLRISDRMPALGLFERDEPLPVHSQHGQEKQLLKRFRGVQLQKLIHQDHMAGA